MSGTPSICRSFSLESIAFPHTWYQNIPIRKVHVVVIFVKYRTAHFGAIQLFTDVSKFSTILCDLICDKVFFPPIPVLVHQTRMSLLLLDSTTCFISQQSQAAVMTPFWPHAKTNLKKLRQGLRYDWTFCFLLFCFFLRLITELSSWFGKCVFSVGSMSHTG